MFSLSALVTRSFGGRDTGSASTDDRLDRFDNRRLRTTTVPANGSPAREAIRQPPNMGHLIASAPRWLYDFSPVESFDFD
jgi:hypothetical protein